MDLTKKKGEILNSFKNLQTIINIQVDALLVVNDKGIIQFMNPAAELLLNIHLKKEEPVLFGFPVGGNKFNEIEILSKTKGISYVEMRSIEIEWEEKKSFLILLHDITSHRISEKNMERVLRYEKLLSSISQNAINPQNIIEFFKKSGELIGNAINCSKVYFFQYKNKEDVYENITYWVNQIDNQNKKEYDSNFFDSHQILFNFLKNEIKILEIIHEKEFSIEKNLKNLNSNEDYPIIIIPLKIGDKYYGFLGIEYNSRTFYEHKEHMDFFQTIGSLISAAITQWHYNMNLELIVEQRTKNLDSTILNLEKEIKYREEIEIQLRIAKKIAEAANKAKSEFLANMSHELRTPLNSIIGFCEVLQDGLSGSINPEQQDLINIIHESGDHLLNVINNILDISKIEANKFELIYEKSFIRDVIRKSIDLLSIKKKRIIEIEIAKEADLEMILEPIKLKQILLNLIGNAIKFTPETGKIGIKVKREENTIQFMIWDEGIGIKKENFCKLFQPFMQIDMTYSKNFIGTGLGLHFCKKMVELFGGNIWVESIFGSGSKFYFTIPFNNNLTDKNNINVIENVN